MNLDDLTTQIEHALDVLRPIVHDLGDDDWDPHTDSTSAPGCARSSAMVRSSTSVPARDRSRSRSAV
jgi:hypothetical protein